MAIYPLKNQILNSHWGCPNTMSQLFGYSNPEQLPMAELWMGAHLSAPSQITTNSGLCCLATWIEQNGEKALGERAHNYFDGELSFLFKILSAKSPLSIQSHPSKDQALKGWTRENAQGLSLHDPQRSYKDKNHKPELVYALTYYHALNGFKPLDSIIEVFSHLKCELLSTYLDELRSDKTEEGLKRFYSAIMVFPHQRALLEQILASCLDAIEANELNESLLTTYRLAIKLHEYYPYDIGIVGALVLNYVVLAPGEAMFLRAGTLHAYLEGTALELMASSDNVLRGGLTPKHIDINELFETTNFSSLYPEQILQPPVEKTRNSKEFAPPCEDFKLSIIDLTLVDEDVLESHQSEAAQIAFVITGSVELADDVGNQHTFSSGESCFISADTKVLTVSGNGKVAIASSGKI
ncbi:mannose-6-phosphate isomerase, class I [Vibrio astriarenae]